MTSKLFAVLFLAVTNAYLLDKVENVFGDNPSTQFIYGKITTVDGDEYQGQLRWGAEEVFWFDFFNSTKEKNENLKWLSRDQEDALSAGSSSSKGWWSKWNTTWTSAANTHVFACQFGDIKSIHIHHGEKVTVEFKDGSSYHLEGGSNDIGAQIQMSDQELGVIKMDWNRIEKVEFMQAPGNMESAFGRPLYGVVKTIRGQFEGYLQWDHDERLTSDVLNGETHDGELDIEFGNIKSIRRTHKGSEVHLNSGRTFEMWGTNDVDDDNRGIIVSTPNYGRVDIPWDEFEEMIIEDMPSGRQLDYDDYRGFAKLQGTVLTLDGKEFTGNVIYDLDETYQLEMLNGEIDDVEYFIPFSAIKSVQPKNRKESAVILNNGEVFIFEGKVDVNEDNDGILVFGDRKDPDYIAWSEIDKITFD